MSPLKLVRPTMAPDVIGRRGVGEGELEQEEGEERDAGRRCSRRSSRCRKKYWCPMRPLPTPNWKAKPIAQYRSPHRHVSKMHSIRMLTVSRDRAKPGFEGHEPGLHEEHEEGGDQHPHRVDRVDEVGGLRRRLRRGRAGRGLEQVDRERDDRRRRPTMPSIFAGEQEREPLLRLPLRERLDRQAFSRLSRPAPGITTRFERPECTDVCHELCHASELKNPVFPVRVPGLKAKRQVTAREGDVL